MERGRHVTLRTPRVEVSLDTLNPKLLLVLKLVPYMVYTLVYEWVHENLM